MKRTLLRIGRHWKALLALNILIFSSAYALRSRFPSEVWVANAKLIIPEASSQVEADLGVLGTVRNQNLGFSPLVNPRDLQISVLNSDIVMTRVLEGDPYKEDFENLSDFKKIFSISQIVGTTGFQISTSAEDEDLAFQRLSRLVDAFYERLYELRVTEVGTLDRFADERTLQAERELNEARQRLTRFQEASGVLNADVQIQNLLASIDGLKSQYDQAVLNAVNDTNQLRVLEQRVGLSLGQAVGALELGQNPNYQFVSQRLTETSAKLAEAQAAFTDESAQVRLLVREQRELEEQLQRIVRGVGVSPTIDPSIASGSEGRQDIIQQMILLDSQANAQRARAAQVQSMIQELNSSLALLPEAQAQLQNLQREYTLAEGRYQGILAQAEQASINAITSYPNVQLLDPPRVDSEVSANWHLFAINAVIASVLASGALFLLLESRNPYSSSPSSLKLEQFDKERQL